MAFAANERIVLLAKDALTNTKLDGSHRISVYRSRYAGVFKKPDLRLNIWPYCSGSPDSANASLS
jgi:hypothetical protein